MEQIEIDVENGRPNNTPARRTHIYGRRCTPIFKEYWFFFIIILMPALFIVIMFICSQSMRDVDFCKKLLLNNSTNVTFLSRQGYLLESFLNWTSIYKDFISAVKPVKL